MIQFSKTIKKNLQDPTEPAKTYATAQSRGIWQITDLARHMAAHGTPLSRGTITAVITDMVSCMREALLDGYILHMGDLGNFYAMIKSRGVCESVEDEDTHKKPVFTAADIYDVTLRFDAGREFESMMEDAEFTEVLTKNEQAIRIKEKKEQLQNGTYKPSTNTNTNSGGSNEHE